MFRKSDISVTESQSNQAQNKVAKLSNFDLIGVVREALSRKNKNEESIDLKLTKIRDSILGGAVVCGPDFVKEALKVFYDHPSLSFNGRKIESINPGNKNARIVKHLLEQSSSDKATFKNLLYDIFNLLCQASIANPAKKSEFFDVFPLVDLECLGGTGSKVEGMSDALQSDSTDRYIIDAYNASLSQMQEKIEPFLFWRYHAHITQYLNYILSLKTEDEAKRVDNGCFAVAAAVPAHVLAEILEEFPQKFKVYLGKFLSKEDLMEEVAVQIKEARKVVINRVNDDENLPGAPKILNIRDGGSHDIFDDYIYEEDFNYNENNPRISFAVAGLFGQLNMEDASVREYFYSANKGVDPKNEEVFLRLNVKKLTQALYQKKIMQIDKDFSELIGDNAVEKKIELSGVAKLAYSNYFDGSSYAGSESLEAALYRSHNSSSANIAAIESVAKPLMSTKIYSQDVALEIKERLKSDNLEDALSAIEMLYVLSIDAKGGAPIHFKKVIEFKDAEIEKTLIALFHQLHAKIPVNYTEKLSILLGRYEKCRSIFANDSELLPRDKFKWATQDSTQKALQHIESLKENGKLSESLYEANLNFVLRGDAMEIARVILDADLDWKQEVPQNFLQRLLVKCCVCPSTFEILEKVAEKMKENEVDVNFAITANRTTILAASTYNNVRALNSLLEDEKSKDFLDHVDSDSGNAALNMAVENRYLKVVELLLKKKSSLPFDEKNLLNVDILGGEEVTSLYMAVGLGEYVVAEKLIDAGANTGFRAQSDGNKTLLILSAEQGHLDIVQLLIERGEGGNIGEVDGDGLTALHMAATYNKIDVVRYLLENCSVDDLDRQDEGGWTSLYTAVYHGYTDLVELFLDKKADFSVGSKIESDGGGSYYTTPLQKAEEMGYSKISALLENAATRKKEASGVVAGFSGDVSVADVRMVGAEAPPPAADRVESPDGVFAGANNALHNARDQ